MEPNREMGVATVLLLAWISCDSGRSVRTLSSGMEVTVRSVSGVESEEPGTLYVEYVTDLPIDNHVALAQEVREIWSELREHAEETHSSTVLICPKDVEGSETTFPVTRRPDGEWFVPHVVTLASGTRVVVVSQEIEDGALFVDYTTTLPVTLAEVCTLAPEVDQVWAEFRNVAESAGLRAAFVMPNETPIGGMVAFSFKRDDQGQWSRQLGANCQGAPAVAASSLANECDEEVVRPTFVGERREVKFPERYMTGRYRLSVCIFQATVDVDGSVTGVRLIRPQGIPSDLERSMRDTLESSRYEPATRCGRAVPYDMTVTFNHCPIE